MDRLEVGWLASPVSSSDRGAPAKYFGDASGNFVALHSVPDGQRLPEALPILLLRPSDPERSRRAGKHRYPHTVRFLGTVDSSHRQSEFLRGRSLLNGKGPTDQRQTAYARPYR